MFITTNELLERIEALEKRLKPDYILIKDAVLKYGQSERTILKKIKKYNIQKLKVGKVKNNPINENQLIEALQQREPAPKLLTGKKW